MGGMIWILEFDEALWVIIELVISGGYYMY